MVVVANSSSIGTDIIIMVELEKIMAVVNNNNNNITVAEMVVAVVESITPERVEMETMKETENNSRIIITIKLPAVARILTNEIMVVEIPIEVKEEAEAAVDQGTKGDQGKGPTDIATVDPEMAPAPPTIDKVPDLVPAADGPAIIAAGGIGMGINEARANANEAVAKGCTVVEAVLDRATPLETEEVGVVAAAVVVVVDAAPENENEIVTIEMVVEGEEEIGVGVEAVHNHAVEAAGVFLESVVAVVVVIRGVGRIDLVVRNVPLGVVGGVRTRAEMMTGMVPVVEEEVVDVEEEEEVVVVPLGEVKVDPMNSDQMSGDPMSEGQMNVICSVIPIAILAEEEEVVEEVQVAVAVEVGIMAATTTTPTTMEVVRGKGDDATEIGIGMAVVVATITTMAITIAIAMETMQFLPTMGQVVETTTLVVVKGTTSR